MLILSIIIMHDNNGSNSNDSNTRTNYSSNNKTH